MDFGLYVGTIGTSVWFSYDLGETWDRPYSESDFIWNAVPGRSQRALRIRRASSRAPTKGFIDGISPMEVEPSFFGDGRDTDLGLGTIAP